jgi:hypothetical protein
MNLKLNLCFFAFCIVSPFVSAYAIAGEPDAHLLKSIHEQAIKSFLSDLYWGAKTIAIPIEDLRMGIDTVFLVGKSEVFVLIDHEGFQHSNYRYRLDSLGNIDQTESS